MTITSEDSAAATAAVANLQSLLTTYEVKSDPAAQDLFARESMLAPIAAARPLAISLGQALLTERTAAAHAAVAPFALNSVEENRIVGELGKLRQLYGWLGGLRSFVQEPGGVRSNARLLIAIFQTVLAAA